MSNSGSTEEAVRVGCAPDVRAALLDAKHKISEREAGLAAGEALCGRECASQFLDYNVERDIEKTLLLYGFSPTQASWLTGFTLGLIGRESHHTSFAETDHSSFTLDQYGRDTTSNGQG